MNGNSYALLENLHFKQVQIAYLAVISCLDELVKYSAHARIRPQALFAIFVLELPKQCLPLQSDDANFCIL